SDLAVQVSAACALDGGEFEHLTAGQERRQVMRPAARTGKNLHALKSEDRPHDREKIRRDGHAVVGTQARAQTMVDCILDGWYPMPHRHLDLWAQRDVASCVPDHPPRIAAEIRAMDVFIAGPQQSRPAERQQPRAVVAHMQDGWYPGIAGDAKGLGIESDP